MLISTLEMQRHPGSACKSATTGPRSWGQGHCDPELSHFVSLETHFPKDLFPKLMPSNMPLAAPSLWHSPPQIWHLKGDTFPFS